jgi:transposase
MIRGLLLERGITVRQGRGHIDAALPGILEDASAQLSGALRVLLVQLKLELDHLQMRIDEADAMINKVAGENEACRRLVAIPGIGPVTATAIIAAIGNGAAFKKGRGFSAWLGIVPGEYTTGGKQKLLGTSKRGNSYLRRLFVQGARAVLQQKAKQSSGLSAWLAQLTTRAHSNVAAVALANKLARIAWAVLAKNEPCFLRARPRKWDPPQASMPINSTCRFAVKCSSCLRENFLRTTTPPCRSSPTK